MSPSSSSWSRLAQRRAVVRASLSTPSLSMSASHTSPMPSPSVSAWVGLAMSGQLSKLSPTLSPSMSTLQHGASGGHRLVRVGDAAGSCPRRPSTPSLSSSGRTRRPMRVAVGVRSGRGLGIVGAVVGVVGDAVAVDVARRSRRPGRRRRCRAGRSWRAPSSCRRRRPRRRRRRPPGRGWRRTGSCPGRPPCRRRPRRRCRPASCRRRCRPPRPSSRSRSRSRRPPPCGVPHELPRHSGLSCGWSERRAARRRPGQRQRRAEQ